MKLKTIGILVLAGLCCCALAAVLWADDTAEMRLCDNCGMDRKAYGYSRMLIRFADGSQVGTCSLNCTVIKLDEQKGRPVQALLVADRGTRRLTDARTAHWTMGGNKRGVMTTRPKWCFAKKSDAEAFVKEQGGALVGWETALRAAREDAYGKK